LIDYIVGWVEATKPFDYAQGNAQQDQILVLGGPCTSTTRSLSEVEGQWPR